MSEIIFSSRKTQIQHEEVLFMILFDNVLCAVHFALKLWFTDSKQQFEVSELQKSLKKSIWNFKP